MQDTSRSRYQFYLDNSTIKSLSQMSREIGISRSQLVREALEGLVNMYALKRKAKMEKNYAKLLELSGIIKVNQTKLSSYVDEIYLIDQIREKHGIS